MTPIDLAQNLAQSDDPKARVMGVAIITRGLSDDDGLRAGWPLDQNTVRAAAKYVGLGSVGEDFVDEVLMLAPTLSDAILNR